MPETDTSVSLYIIDNILVVMICRRAVDVKFHKGIPAQSGNQIVDLIEQSELPHI